MNKKCYGRPSTTDSPQGSASSLSPSHFGHESGSSHSATSQQGSRHQVRMVKPGQNAVIIEAMRLNDLFPGKPQGGASDNASVSSLLGIEGPVRPASGSPAASAGSDAVIELQQPSQGSTTMIQDPQGRHSPSSGSDSGSSGGCISCLKKIACKCTED